MKTEVNRVLNLMKKYDNDYRKDMHCALYVLVDSIKETNLNLRYIYDEDKNEMKVVRIFINYEDECKLCIDYYYIENGKEVTDLITEPITDFPTSTMFEIVSQWNKHLIKAQ